MRFGTEDGLKMFKILQKHDKMKKEWSKKNKNPNLLVIPYWKFNQIEEILERELNLDK